MKIYLNENVYVKSIDRINYLFDQFENVVVGFSGGKDSTTCLNLCLQVATERNRLPLSVLWIDQEAEWQGTVDYCELIMSRPDIKPYWLQMPMVITNNASSYERYSNCWDESKKDLWIHPKNELSIKENTYGTDRFHELFEKIFAKEFKDQKSCYISGVRCEESPKRQMTLTNGLTYQNITWGKLLSKKLQHYTFYPIYDWSYTDVWKYIFDNKIPYNRIYDEMYRHGVSVMNMRVSNLHHETAIQNLLLIQEIEPETWEKICVRVDGVNTIKHLEKESYTCPKELPFMFSGWKEYAYYLADNIIQDDANKKMLYSRISKTADFYSHELINNDFYRKVIDTILSSDWDFTKLTNFNLSPHVNAYKDFKKGIHNKYVERYNKYIPNERGL